MKKLTLLLAICWGFTLSAVDMKDPIQDIKTSYQSIKASFNPDQNQFLGIVKNEKVNTFIKGTPMEFWINTINASNQQNLQYRSRRTKSYITEYNVLDTLTIDIADFDLMFGKGMLTMDYNNDAMCQSIEASVCYSDTTMCIGGMYLSYNKSSMIDTMTVKIVDDDDQLSTAGQIVAEYNCNDYITKLSLNLSYSNLKLEFDNAIVFDIKYDESSQLTQVSLTADADFTTFVTCEMMSIKDSLTFEEEIVSLGEIEISRNSNNDIVSLSGKYNDILKGKWYGEKHEVTYQDTLITEYKFTRLGADGWIDSLAHIDSYEYDLNDNLITYMSSYYDTQYQSRGYSPFVRLYYNDNQQIDSIYEYQISAEEQADLNDIEDLDKKYCYEYDCDGNMISSTRSSHNGFSWNKSSRKEYEYDVNKLLTSYTDYSYFTHTDSILRYQKKYTFAYNSENHLATYTIIDGNSKKYYGDDAVVDSVLQYWTYNRQYTLTWSGDFLETLIYKHYDETCWKNEEKIAFTRDANENFTGGQYYTNYDSETGWVSLAGLKIDYNNDIELDDIELPNFISSFSKQILQSQGLNKDLSTSIIPLEDLPLSTKRLGYNDLDDALNGLLVNFQMNNAPSKISVMLDSNRDSVSGTIDFHYRKIIKDYSTFNVNRIENSQDLNIYPNPASSTVSITGANDGDRIKIYDVNGRQVMQQSIINTNSIDISSLLKGLYMYSVSSGSLEHKGKLMVE